MKEKIIIPELTFEENYNIHFFNHFLSDKMINLFQR